MILQFENSEGKRKIIGNPETMQEAWEIIDKFLKDHKFKSHYKRLNLFDTEWQIDVGSWSEFFYLSDIPDEIKKEYKN